VYNTVAADRFILVMGRSGGGTSVRGSHLRKWLGLADASTLTLALGG